MGRLEEIAERNKNPRKHRKGQFPVGIALAGFVLLILILLIFTDLAQPNLPAKQPPPPEEKGRVKDIGIHVEKPRADAGATSD